MLAVHVHVRVRVRVCVRMGVRVGVRVPCAGSTLTVCPAGRLHVYADRVRAAVGCACWQCSVGVGAGVSVGVGVGVRVGVRVRVWECTIAGRVLGVRVSIACTTPNECELAETVSVRAPTVH